MDKKDLQIKEISDVILDHIVQSHGESFEVENGETATEYKCSCGALIYVCSRAKGKESNSLHVALADHTAYNIFKALKEKSNLRE